MKTKTLISCAVTAQLVCIIVFAYANRWFSHAKAHLDINMRKVEVVCSKSDDQSLVKRVNVGYIAQ